MLTSQNTAQIQHLLDLLRAGDDSARDALLECSLDRIHELARRMFHRQHDLRQLSQTDDVLQKALIRLHAALNGVQPADVRTYYGLAARQIRWVLRDLAGEKAAAQFVNYTPTPPECEDETAEPRDLEQWSAFHETIEGLDEEVREMFDLLFYEGVTQEEAAEALQTSIRTVRRRWQRAPATRTGFARRLAPGVTMDEERLEDLLLRWEDLQESGETVDVETLCRDCPELSAELRRRIEALRRVAWVGRRNGECPVAPEWYELRPGAEPVRGYRLVQRLGEGGFAEVWKAEGPQGPVALKFIAQTDDAARVERRSLAVIKHLEHPNLLPTYETWQVDGFFVVAMELADGTLMDRWRREQAAGGVGIPRDELLRYLREAAEGIDFLQKRYIQHRDIKPQNLFLVGDTLKVGDFGLMRLLAHSITGHSGCLTLFYSPPEFFEGKTTRQSDVYSLAVTYCQMRGGRLPFEGSVAALVAAHLRRTPDLSMLPTEERPVVAKALSKRPDERWPTCRAFVEALTNPPKSLHRRALWPWLTACVLAVAVCTAFWLPRSTPPPSTESPAPLRAFEVPPLPPQARNLVRNVSVARMGEPFNGFVALSNGAGGSRLWDVATGKVIRDLGEPGGPGIALAPFEIPLGLSGCDDAGVILRDLRDGHEVRRFEGHKLSVSSVAFSPDGNQVLTGSCDSLVRLFDRQTGKEIHSLRGHKGIVMSVAFGPRGRLAISGGWDGTVRVWDLEKGKEITRFDGHTSKVWCVACSLDGRWGLSGGEDCVVRLWDLHSGEEVRRFEGHIGMVGSVSFRFPNRVISVGDHTARVWDMNDGRELCRSPELPSGANCGTFFDFDGVPCILIGTERDGLYLWRVPLEAGLMGG